ncbi:MAG: glycosyltransferase family 2 protein [Thermosphaera sp.]
MGRNTVANQLSVKEEPKVSVVIPIHNGIHNTVECLRSLERVTYPNFEVIVVDDGSTDGSWEIISQNFPKVRLLKGDGDLWWAGAINIGIKDAIERCTDYILTLNNDVVVDPNFINALVECAKANPKSIIGSKIYFYNEPKRVWSAGGFVDWKIGWLSMLDKGDYDKGQYEECREVDFLTGMSVLIPAEVFREMKVFYDERCLPQYHSDSEFTMRAKKNGYKIMFEPKSFVWNKVESSGLINPAVKLNLLIAVKSLFSRRSAFNFKANFILFWRHCPKRYLLQSLFLFYLRYFIAYYFPESFKIKLKKFGVKIHLIPNFKFEEND